MKQVRQMIQLNEDYALSADSMNILLHQRKVNQREGTKGYGDEYYSVIGYYTSVESVLKALINKQIQLSILNLKAEVFKVDLDVHKTQVDEIKSDILETLDKINQVWS